MRRTGFRRRAGTTRLLLEPRRYVLGNLLFLGRVAVERILTRR
ncbi:hypothetical protein [Umezawaea sp.]